MSRLLTAAVAVPLLLAILLLGPDWLFFALALVVALLGYWELGALMKSSGQDLLGAGYLTVLLVTSAFYFEPLTLTHATLASILVIGGAVVFQWSPSRDRLVGAMGTFFATFYVGALMGSIVALRTLDPEPAGRHWVIFLLAVVFVGDAGAFYSGRSLGRHALAPRLSPKKTVEGLVGGIVASIAAAVALAELWFPELQTSAAIGLGLMLGLLGVLGDLFESFLKRSAGVKDTSALIPGHGGILDRIDSVLFAAPALLLCLLWMA